MDFIVNDQIPINGRGVSSGPSHEKGVMLKSDVEFQERVEVDSSRTRSDGQVTRLLRDLTQGVTSSQDELCRLLYADLHRLAESALRRERPGPTLQPTLLVNDALIRLLGAENVIWQDRAHFLALAARNIRQVLIDHSRKRRMPGQRVEVEDVVDLVARKTMLPFDALESALSDLSTLNERQARVVEMRFFAGMGVEETAFVLGVSERTVKNDWRFARSWLRTRLSSAA